MRLRFLVSILIVLFSVVAADSAEAQNMRKKSYLKKRNRMISKYRGGSIHFNKSKRYLSAELNVNFNNYFGDLAPTEKRFSTDLSLTRPGVGAYAVYRYTPNLSFRGGFSWSRIRGDDFNSTESGDANAQFRYVRNLSFRNNLYELSVQGMWDIFGNHGTFLNRVPFTPYVFAGVAVFYHEPKGKVPDFYYHDPSGPVPLENAGEWVKLRDLGTEGQFSEHYNVEPYSPIQLSIPLGIGVRARLSKRMDFAFELGYKYLFTDYIDDVSGHFVDLGALDNDLARAMSNRSLEPTAVISGSPREFERINAVAREITYVSPYDGNTYRAHGGYGHEHPSNNRGGAGDKDQIFVTSFKLTYVLTGSFQRAKFR